MISLRQAFMLENGGVVSIVGAGGKTTLMYRLARELAEAGESVLTTTTTKILKPEKDQAAHFIFARSVEEIVKRAEELPANHPHLCASLEQIDPNGKTKGFPPEWIDELMQTHVFKWILVEADGAARKPLKAPADYEPVIAQTTKWVVGVMGLDALQKPFGSEWVFRSELFQALTGLSMGEPITPEVVVTAIIHQKGLFKDCPLSTKRILFLNKADLAGALDQGRRIIACLQKEANENPIRVVIGQVQQAVPVLEYVDL
ncbi:MAG: putative selenium-dependent hydroxylase accessory protein YqeC [Desulfobacteraceae bacterium]|nr:MAG: putative selenium-dependent hydroxylase accessory protein YqeC [Desulfobacteraceae bacterium]